MKFWEAMKRLQEGNKVRCVRWNEGDYIDSGNFVAACRVNIDCSMDEEWQLFFDSTKTHSWAEVVQGLKKGKKYQRKDQFDNTEYLQQQSGRIFVFPGGLAWLCRVEDFEASDWIEVP